MNLQGISTNLMEWPVPDVPEDAPKWAQSEPYPGDAQEAAEALLSATFWKLTHKAVKEAVDQGKPAPDVNDPATRSLIMADALSQTARLLKSKSGQFDRAEVYILWNVQRTGAYHFKEYETVAEYLLGELIEIEDERDGRRSDILFFLKDLFPILDKMNAQGWRVEDILGIQGNLSRARAAVPHIRRDIQEYLNTPRVLEAQIEDLGKQRTIKEKEAKIFEAAGDTENPEYNVTISEIQQLEENINGLQKSVPVEIEKATERFQKRIALALATISDPSVKAWSSNPLDVTIKSVLGDIPAPDPVVGYTAVIPGGQIYVVIAPLWATRAIETSLAHIVDFNISDPGVMASDITAAVKKSPFLPNQ